MIGRLRQAVGPVERSGLALLAGAGFASVLGFLFWTLAARRYQPDEVGLATAMVATMMFLANLATLGLRNGILRFASRGGAGGVRLARSSYAICLAAGVVVGCVFLVGQPWWATGLGILREIPWLGVGFVLATAAWTLFILQDAVLTAFDRSALVPVVQIGSGMAKLALLVLLVALPGAIFLAYSAPTLAALAIVTILVLGRRVAPVPSSVSEVPPLGGLFRFAVVEHLSALVWLAAVDLLPLLVLEREGAHASAYYYMAFTTAYFLYLVSSSFGSALLVAASRDLDRLPALARRSLGNALALVGCGVLLGMFAAPGYLALLGPGYAEHAALLRLLFLSALPQVVVGISASVARARRHLGALAAQQTAVSLLVIVGAVIGLRKLGLEGVGWAWLMAQSIVAIGVLVTTLREVWLGSMPLSLLSLLTRGRRLAARVPRLRRARAVAAAVEARTGRPVSGVSLMASDSHLLVAAADLDGEPVIIRAALRDTAHPSLQRCGDALETLAADERIGSLRQAIPRVRGRLDDLGILVEERLPGRSGAECPGRADEVAELFARGIARLHASTARAGDGRAAASALRHRTTLLDRLPGADRRRDQLGRLTAAHADLLLDVAPTLSVTHGDCWHGNVLVSGGGAAGTNGDDGPLELTGIIDWEDSRSDGVPDVDLAHLWLTSQPVEIGPALVAGLRDPGAFEDWLERIGVVRPNPRLPARLVLTLAWLEHVAGAVTRAARPVSMPWTERNVDAPLEPALHAARLRATP